MRAWNTACIERPTVSLPLVTFVAENPYRSANAAGFFAFWPVAPPFLGAVVGTMSSSRFCGGLTMARFFLLRSRRSASPTHSTPSHPKGSRKTRESDLLAARSLSVSIGVDAFFRLDLALSVLPGAGSCVSDGVSPEAGGGPCFGSVTVAGSRSCVRDVPRPAFSVSWDREVLFSGTRERRTGVSNPNSSLRSGLAGVPWRSCSVV
jgi:hypothetical protein